MILILHREMPHRGNRQVSFSQRSASDNRGLKRDYGRIGNQPSIFTTASNHVHANVKGLDEDPWADMLPTMKGLSLAGYEGMARLADATAIMLNLRPTTDTERLQHDLAQLVGTAAERFQALEGKFDTQAQPDSDSV